MKVFRFSLAAVMAVGLMDLMRCGNSRRDVF